MSRECSVYAASKERSLTRLINRGTPDDPLPDTEDFVTTRILWLDGLDEENANTRDRYIYIHGTRHEDGIGTPDSHGCIRMRNADVVELFNLVDETTQVVIRE